MEELPESIISIPSDLIPKPQEFCYADSHTNATEPIHFEVTGSEKVFIPYRGMKVETEEEHNQRIGNIFTTWIYSIAELYSIWYVYYIGEHEESPEIFRIFSITSFLVMSPIFITRIFNTIKYYAKKSGELEEAIALFKQLKGCLLRKKKENDGKIHR